MEKLISHNFRNTDEEKDMPKVCNLKRSSTLTSSRRASIRGETFRSNLIQRSSIRSRRGISPTLEEERL